MSERNLFSPLSADAIDFHEVKHSASLELVLPAGIKPYYQENGIAIIHGDCQAILKCLPCAFCGDCSVPLADEGIVAIHAAAGHLVRPYVDLTLTDPPYGVGFAEWDEKIPPLD